MFDFFRKKDKLVNYKYDDRSYVKSKLICDNRNTDNIIILISLTKDYLDSALEFVSIAAEYANAYFAQGYTEIESNNKDKEEFVKNAIEANQYYYIIISGSINEYIEVYKHINISNRILTEITKDIYNCGIAESFKELIDDGILVAYKFMGKHKPVEKTYNISRRFTAVVDDIEYILKELPSDFHANELISMFKVKRNNFMSLPLSLVLSTYENPDIPVHVLLEIISPIAGKNATVESIKSLLSPLYSQNIEDYSSGEMDNIEIDELFQQEYDRFNGEIKNDEIDLQYVEIDEVIDTIDDNIYDEQEEE